MPIFHKLEGIKIRFVSGSKHPSSLQAMTDRYAELETARNRYKISVRSYDKNGFLLEHGAGHLSSKKR